MPLIKTKFGLKAKSTIGLLLKHSNIMYMFIIIKFTIWQFSSFLNSVNKKTNTAKHGINETKI